MAKTKPVGVDLDDEVAAAVFASVVPASCLHDLGALYPCKGGIRAPPWGGSSKHKHLLGDVLEASVG